MSTDPDIKSVLRGGKVDEERMGCMDQNNVVMYMYIVLQSQKAVSAYLYK